MSTTEYSPHISNGVSGVTSHRVGMSLIDVIRIIVAGVALRYYFTSRSRGLLQQSYAPLPQEEYKCASKDVLKIAKLASRRAVDDNLIAQARGGGDVSNPNLVEMPSEPTGEAAVASELHGRDAFTQQVIATFPPEVVVGDGERGLVPIRSSHELFGSRSDIDDGTMDNGCSGHWFPWASKTDESTAMVDGGVEDERSKERAERQVGAHRQALDPAPMARKCASYSGGMRRRYWSLASVRCPARKPPTPTLPIVNTSSLRLGVKYRRKHLTCSSSKTVSGVVPNTTTFSCFLGLQMRGRRQCTAETQTSRRTLLPHTHTRSPLLKNTRLGSWGRVRRERVGTVNLGKSRVAGIVGPKWGRCHPKIFVAQGGGWWRVENTYPSQGGGLATTQRKGGERIEMSGPQPQWLVECILYGGETRNLCSAHHKGNRWNHASQKCLGVTVIGTQVTEDSVGFLGPRGWEDNTMPFDTRGGVTTSHQVVMTFGQEAWHVTVSLRTPDATWVRLERCLFLFPYRCGIP
ncbi:hypothetical protein EDB85DRAFT_1890007 [Lactarius pseudohatsudake]|nr:hypothetical protein EDB85DRAFT_1890007 [Lactarius pseudohatsudake]